MSRALIVVLMLVVVGCAGSRRPGVDPGPGSGASSTDAPSVATLEVHAIDALTGAPIRSLSPVGFDTSEGLAEVMPAGPTLAADGNYRFEFGAISGRVRLASDGYAETWTPRFSLRDGETKGMTLRLLPLNHLVVTVLEADGSPVREGTLRLQGANHRSATPIRDGVADTWIEPDRVRIAVDPRFMEGYRPQSQVVTLPRGERTEVTIRVQRQ